MWVLEHAVKLGKSILSLDRACANTPNCPTALLCLAEHGHELPNAVEVLNLLLDQGVDVNVQKWYRDEMTPLMHICYQNRPTKTATVHGRRYATQFLETLLTRRPQLDLRNGDGRTALIYAASSRNVEAVQLLIKAEADVNVTSLSGVTALSLCASTTASSDAVTIARLLIAAEADMNEADGNSSALMQLLRGYYKCNEHTIALVTLIIDAGANVNTHDTAERTPLMHAVSNRNYLLHQHTIDIVKLLLAAGVDVNAQDRMNYSAVMLLIRNNKPDMHLDADILGEGRSFSEPAANWCRGNNIEDPPGICKSI